MPTQQEIWCTEIDELLENPATCTADLLRQMKNVIRLLSNVAGCSGNCNTVNYVYVPDGTLTSEFIDVGWDGVRPSAAVHPLLYVIRSCEVFIGVNNSLCDLESGFGWCALCTARVKTFANLIYTPLDVLVNSGSFAPRPYVGQWSIDFNNGVSLAVGGQPRLDTPMVNVPTHCFQLDEGLYEIDVRVPTLLTGNISTDNGNIDIRLYDVTNSTPVVAQQRGKLQSVASVMGTFKVAVNLTAPTIFRVDYRVTGITGTPVFNSSTYDQIGIERIA